MTNNATHARRHPEFTIGDRLRKARETADLTIPKMADILGVNEKTVRNYEHEATPMKRATIIAWAMSTGVPVEWLEHGTTTPPPDEGVTLRSRPAKVLDLHHRSRHGPRKVA